MTIQKFLNNMNNDIYTFYITNIEFRITLSLILLIIIAFSIYGWLCTFHVISDNLGFCAGSFAIALSSEIALGLFWICPMILGCMLNCIYPVQLNNAPARPSRIPDTPRPVISDLPKSPKTPIPDHAYTSFNRLYMIQEKRKSKSPSRRLSV
jgi:hypothetical protein